MTRRIAVGVALGALVVGLLLAGRLPVAILVGVLCVLAADELLRLARSRGVRSVPLAAFLGIAALIVIAYMRGEKGAVMFPAAVAGAVALSALALMFRRAMGGTTTAISTTALAVVYVGVLPAYIVVVLAMPWGRSLVFGLAVLVVANDVASYVVGARFGRRPLAPTVSPAKTWEGFFAGAVATLIAGAVLGVTMSPAFTVARALILAGVVAIAAPIGDLTESMIKRDVGAKDSGTLLPGHGGILDRFDSFIVTAPLFFYAYRALVR